MPSPLSPDTRASTRVTRRDLARRRRMFARRRAATIAVAVLVVAGTIAGIVSINRPSAASAGAAGAGAAGIAAASLAGDAATAARSVADEVREETATKAERVLGRYSDASTQTEGALADAIAHLRTADEADLPTALTATAAAQKAVIDDAKAFRADLIDASASTNTQPVDGDVSAQLSYLFDHVFDYNSDQWGDYNPYGGDCTNFASQGLLARGWQIDDTWYSRGGMWTASKPWIATAAMAAYFDILGLTYSTQEDLDRVRVGDVGLFDWGETGAGYDHTMTVSKVTYTADGPIVYFVSHNHDGKYRELQETLYTEHTDSTVRIYHIP